jgi:hypothetical protein
LDAPADATPRSPGASRGATDVADDPNAPRDPFAPEAGRATAAFGADAASRVSQGEAILRANGQWPPKDGEIYVVQIDQDSPPASAAYKKRRDWLVSYSGQTVVFQARDGGLVEVGGPLRSASHAGQFSARDGTFTDVNADNAPDIAQIHTGVYRYETRTRSDRLNLDDFGSVNAGRDINHDGVISGARERRRYRASAIQIHAGDPDRPVSVGCQTLPPDDFRTLTGLVRSNGQSTFTYVLVRRPNTDQGTGEYRWQ